MHTMGPCSIALLRHELKESHLEKKPPSQAEVYKHSRKRVSGRKYKTSGEKALENIEKIDELELQYRNDEGGSSKDPYYGVITKGEYHGRLRLHGRGVTKSMMNEMGKGPSYTVPPEFLQSIKEDLVQQLTPDLPLPSEFLQRVKKDLIQEITPDTATMILSGVKAANPGMQLTIPDFSLSPEGAFSAKSFQTDGQPSNE